MKRRLLLLAALAAACDARAPIEPVELGLTVVAEKDAVELGEAFELTIVRTWEKRLQPEVWDDARLAPLVLAPLGTTRREDDARVEEARRYRARAFTLQDVRLDGLALRARPRAGGAEVVATAPPLQLEVTRLLDPADPAPPELPREPFPAPRRRGPAPWALGLTFAVVTLAAWRLARRPGPPPVETPPAPDPFARARGRLAGLAELTEPEPFATELAAIPRALLAEHLGLPAEARTTAEILADARVTAGLEPAAHAALARVLDGADRVKFGAHVPDAAERAKWTALLERVLQPEGAA